MHARPMHEDVLPRAIAAALQLPGACNTVPEAESSLNASDSISDVPFGTSTGSEVCSEMLCVVSLKSAMADRPHGTRLPFGSRPMSSVELRLSTAPPLASADHRLCSESSYMSSSGKGSSALLSTSAACVGMCVCVSATRRAVCLVSRVCVYAHTAPCTARADGGPYNCTTMYQ